VNRLIRFAWTALNLAFGALRRNLMRAVLTALGILIGVAAVTIVVALGQGASEAVSSRINSLGDNALIVVPEETIRSGVRDDSSLPPLTEDDADALGHQVGSVAAAAPLLNGLSQVAWRDANTNAQTIGTTLDFFRIRVWKVSDGTLWEPSAEKTGAKVCIIGSTVRDQLFGNEEPVGRTIRIGSHPFRVLGVLESKGQSPFGQDQDNVVVVPTSTMRSKLAASTRPGQVDRILLSAKSPDEADRAKREATALLRQRHHLAEGAENDFSIRSQEDFREAQQQIMGVLSLLLLGIAAISLIVGGIGVMNIMLVSVAERTREIGIRMAIGAREADIMVQFLVEAIVLSVGGGMLGAAIASVAIAAIAHGLGWAMTVSVRALTVAFVTSSAVGIGFGFVPARRAARLDPIQALRRE
jgi:putative ABC transport system permease protein